VQRTLALAELLEGFPRHLSIHVGGFVITHGELAEVVPVENASMKDRTVVQWEKDDLNALGIFKVDLLGLGMLTVLGKSFALVGSTRESISTWPPSPARTRRCTGCWGRRTPSASSRWRAGRR
jgi:DNA polymerase III alpha subunit